MPNSTDRAFDLPSDLPRNIEASLKKAAEFALSIQEKDGSWISEVELNPGPTAQAVILHHALAIAFPERLLPKALKYTLRTQQPDGGWGNYENAVSDVSVTAECYVQMRLSGLAANAEPCVRARAVIEKLGGAPAMNPWTQLYLGALGVLPWERIQKIPVELSLIPAWTSVAIENFAYWVKVISTPMMLLHAVGPGKPVAEAPLIAQELGISREDRRVLISRGVSAFLKVFEKTKLLPLRKMAINAALKKIDEFTEKNGDFGGNTCTAMNVLLALDRMGKSGEPRFKNGLKAMMNYGFETDDEWHLQTCQSLVWDTAFMLWALPPALPSALSPA
jgi:squalene-hopene/tetraprenyl-beta-curcumene cyclase